MAGTSHSPTRQVKIINLATLTNISLQGRIYVVRTLFCLATLAQLTFNDTYCREQPGDHLWLLVGGLLYPHIGHLMFGRLDINRRRGHALFLADGMFVGAIMAALDFVLLPSIILAIISIFNWMVVGGLTLVTLGFLLMFAGMLTVTSSLDAIWINSAASCSITNWLACLIAIGYFAAVARLIHTLIGELRLKQVGFQARSDSADSAKSMAEQALLAVLPASAARQMSENGAVATETIPEATLLLLDIRNQDGKLPELAVLQDAVLVSDSILTRHRIDLIKSFGGLILALSKNESGPDDAVKAFLEIDNFYRDHAVKISALRGILHHGSVTVGLVHPQRLNIDVCGPAIDELAKRSSVIASRQQSGLIVTANAYGKLKIQPDNKRIRLDNSHPICNKDSA